MKKKNEICCLIKLILIANVTLLSLISLLNYNTSYTIFKKIIKLFQDFQVRMRKKHLNC